MIFSSNSSPTKLTLLAGLLMVVVYLGLGLLFFFTDIAADTFPVYRKEVGIVMMGYSIFRAYSTIRKLRKVNE